MFWMDFGINPKAGSNARHDRKRLDIKKIVELDGDETWLSMRSQLHLMYFVDWRGSFTNRGNDGRNVLSLPFVCLDEQMGILGGRLPVAEVHYVHYCTCLIERRIYIDCLAHSVGEYYNPQVTRISMNAYKLGRRLVLVPCGGPNQCLHSEAPQAGTTWLQEDVTWTTYSSLPPYY